MALGGTYTNSNNKLMHNYKYSIIMIIILHALCECFIAMARAGAWANVLCCWRQQRTSCSLLLYQQMCLLIPANVPLLKTQADSL